MPDVHDPATRSRNMAAVRRTDTKPELFVRHALHGLGLRFRLHVGGLPGRPDIVLPRHRVVVFVNGCFFHGHGCNLFKWPKSNEDFWREKINRNVERDRLAVAQLQADGWRVATVWECALKGKAKLDGQAAMQSLAQWILEGGDTIVIRGGEDWSHHLSNSQA